MRAQRILGSSSLVVACCGIVLGGCQAEGPPPAPEVVAPVATVTIQASTEATLPKCTQALAGTLAYVKSSAGGTAAQPLTTPTAAPAHSTTEG